MINTFLAKSTYLIFLSRFLLKPHWNLGKYLLFLRLSANKNTPQFHKTWQMLHTTRTVTTVLSTQLWEALQERALRGLFHHTFCKIFFKFCHTLGQNTRCPYPNGPKPFVLVEKIIFCRLSSVKDSVSCPYFVNWKQALCKNSLDC